MPRGFEQTSAAMVGIGAWGSFIGTFSAPVYAGLECEIDVGGRFTVWGSRNSHRPLPPIRREDNALRFGPSGRCWRTGSMGRGGSNPPRRGLGAA